VCGTRWACASEVAIWEAMAALYHARNTSRILEGFGACRGLVEPRTGVGCGGACGDKKKPQQRALGLRRDDATAASYQPRGKTIRIVAVAQCRALLN
jgi:hypothetical protein